MAKRFKDIEEFDDILVLKHTGQYQIIFVRMATDKGIMLMNGLLIPPDAFDESFYVDELDNKYYADANWGIEYCQKQHSEALRQLGRCKRLIIEKGAE